MQILPITTEVALAGVAEIAERRLRESPYFFLKTVNCHFHNGVLTLRGQVPYRQLKHFAEAIVSRVAGVEEVVNRVEVFDPVMGQLSAQAVRNAG